MQTIQQTIQPAIQQTIQQPIQATAQPTIQAIRCPNCGNPAERHYLVTNPLIRTQCPTCDYLMITCSRTGKVVEAYAPGIPMHR